MKRSNAWFVLLLLLIAIGTRPGPQALAQEREEGPSTDYVCSTCGFIVESAVSEDEDILAHDNVFTIDLGEQNAGARVELHNINLATLVVRVDSTPQDLTDQDTSLFDGPDANPKIIRMDEDGSAIIVAVHRSSGLRDGRAAPDENGVPVATPGGDDDYRYEVKAFHGNRIRVRHLRHEVNGLLHDDYVTIDNIPPTLWVSKPEQPLYVRSGVNVTFTFAFTDAESGFTGDVAEIASTALAGVPGLIHPEDGGHETHAGGVRFVVAGNVIGLEERHFSRIDDGWRVTRDIGSTSIQNIAANVPWYVEVADNAHNTSRMQGRIAGETAAAGTDRSVVIDILRGGLHENSFLGTEVRVTQEGVTSKPQPIATFTPATGTIAVAEPFFAYDPDTAAVECPGGTAEGCVIGAGASYEILGAGLIVVDSKKPEAVSATTGTSYHRETQSERTGREGMADPKSIKVAFADAARDGDAVPGSGLDPASVTTEAFEVQDNPVRSVLVVENDVYLTLQQSLRSSDEPKVKIKEEVKRKIDGKTVVEKLLRDRAGNPVGNKQLTARDGIGPNLRLSRSGSLGSKEVTIVITADEQLHDRPTLWVTPVNESGGAPYRGSAAAVSPSAIRQTGALEYSYTHTEIDGVFGVYAEGQDELLNMGSVGDRSSVLSFSAFAFEVDTQLNNNVLPIVSVLHHENIALVENAIEQVHTMGVKVTFTEEGNEYARDGYAAVRITSLFIVHEHPTGVVSVWEHDVDTEVGTSDNISFAVTVHEPEVGTFTLRFSAIDAAGNSTIDGEEEFSLSWRVVEAAPYDIPLSPGWNFISLPFMPVYPAINAVVRPGHPVDVVMTFENVHGVWLVSRRDPVTGRFAGDINVLMPHTAYFLRTRSTLPLTLHRPPLSTHDDPPQPPLDIRVSRGWNLVPVVHRNFHIPHGVAADDYFHTLRDGGAPGWVRALTFEPLTRRWVGVSPGDRVSLGPGDVNPCTGVPIDKIKVVARAEPCQAGHYVERSPAGSITPGDLVGEFDGRDRVSLHASLRVGRGYWVYSNVQGRIIP